MSVAGNPETTITTKQFDVFLQTFRTILTNLDEEKNSQLKSNFFGPRAYGTIVDNYRSDLIAYIDIPKGLRIDSSTTKEELAELSEEELNEYSQPNKLPAFVRLMKRLQQEKIPDSYKDQVKALITEAEKFGATPAATQTSQSPSTLANDSNATTSSASAAATSQEDLKQESNATQTKDQLLSGIRDHTLTEVTIPSNFTAVQLVEVFNALITRGEEDARNKSYSPITSIRIHDNSAFQAEMMRDSNRSKDYEKTLLKKLAAAVFNNKYLQQLEVVNCNLFTVDKFWSWQVDKNSSSLTAFTQIVTGHPTLTTLDLSGNRLYEVDAIVKMLANSHLTALKLDSCGLYAGLLQGHWFKTPIPYATVLFQALPDSNVKLLSLRNNSVHYANVDMDDDDEGQVLYKNCSGFEISPKLQHLNISDNLLPYHDDTLIKKYVHNVLEVVGKGFAQNSLLSVSFELTDSSALTYSSKSLNGHLNVLVKTILAPELPIAKRNAALKINLTGHALNADDLRHLINLVLQRPNFIVEVSKNHLDKGCDGLFAELTSIQQKNASSSTIESKRDTSKNSKTKESESDTLKNSSNNSATSDSKFDATIDLFDSAILNSSGSNSPAADAQTVHCVADSKRTTQPNSAEMPKHFQPVLSSHVSSASDSSNPSQNVDSEFEAFAAARLQTKQQSQHEDSANTVRLRNSASASQTDSGIVTSPDTSRATAPPNNAAMGHAAAGLSHKLKMN